MILAGRYWTPCRSSFLLCPVQETLRLCGYLRWVSWPSEDGTKLEGENLVMTINVPINDHVFAATIQAESDTRVKENISRAFLKCSCLLLQTILRLYPNSDLMVIPFRFEVTPTKRTQYLSHRRLCTNQP